jgi:hypothetical protein
MSRWGRSRGREERGRGRWKKRQGENDVWGPLWVVGIEGVKKSGCESIVGMKERYKG